MTQTSGTGMFGFMLEGAGAGTTTTAPAVDSPVRYIGDGTASRRLMPLGGQAVSVRLVIPTADADHVENAASSAESPADQVRRLRDDCALTWDQLARVFGVSRRAVHLWANGSRMNSVHAETLADLIALVSDLPESMTPTQRRDVIFRRDAQGRSALDRLRALHAPGSGDVAGSPRRPDQLLDAQHDDVAMQ